jgi:hypothetical protein
MDPHAYDDLRRQLDAIRNRYLCRLADEDPTLTRLKAALEEKRRWQAMTMDDLVAFCAQLEAKYGVDHGRDA